MSIPSERSDDQELALKLADQWELWSHSHSCNRGPEACVDCRATVTARMLREYGGKHEYVDCPNGSGCPDCLGAEK